MAVHKNSISALTEMPYSHKERCRTSVLKAIIELKEASDQGIAEYLGWTINRVTPRRGELLERMRIYEKGCKIGKYGKRVTVWAAKINKEQLNIPFQL